MDFSELFQGFTGSHGRYQLTGKSRKRDGKKEGRAVTVDGPPSPKAWEEHLSGTGAGLGIIPLLDDNYCVHWGAIDIDVYPLDIEALVEDCKNLPVVVTKSKSQGAHVWLFLSEPVDATLVQEKLRDWASLLGYPSCEIFPKQVERRTDDDRGNWINLPYYGDTRVAMAVGRGELSLDEFLTYANNRRIDEQTLSNIQTRGADDDFSDGPPCLQEIARHRLSDCPRNITLFSFATYFKKKFPETWERKLYEFNDSLEEPLEHNEIKQTIVQSHQRKDYAYKCADTPLCKHCSKGVCRQREYGVGSGQGDIGFELDGLTKVKTQPPMWYLNIDGIRVKLPDTQDLLQQGRFERYCVDQTNRLPKPVNNRQWKALLANLLDNVEEIEVPDEFSAAGGLFDYLTEFVQERQCGEKDRLSQGRVYVENGDAYFRFQDFHSYLKKENWREMEKKEIWAAFNQRGVERKTVNANHSTVSCYVWKEAVLNKEERPVPGFDGDM